MHEVYISKKVLKSIQRLPISIQYKMINLIEDLRDKGPTRWDWPNFSKLDSDIYHCHLAYKCVACWSYNSKQNRIEVYYAGSRENAPY